MKKFAHITADLVEFHKAVSAAHTNEGVNVAGDKDVQHSISKLVSHAKTKAFGDAVSAFHQLATTESDAPKIQPKKTKAKPQKPPVPPNASETSA
ncbi:MAG TPA: hypothetical protein VMU24_02335 [Candidatus Acidoferrales bacterium]|nr:hypothetical protein [Candidatus Acidoferrales bacterium]